MSKHNTGKGPDVSISPKTNFPSDDASVSPNKGKKRKVMTKDIRNEIPDEHMKGKSGKSDRSS